jgi:hypothetical protein
MNARLLGQTLDSRWQVTSQLGAGAMGAVFLARDLEFDRDVAVKFLSPRYVEDAPTRLRFEREAQVMTGLVHPNLVPVYAVGVFEQLPFVVMKYVEGRPLHTRMRRGAPLPVPEAVLIAVQICDGLAHLHARNIVHRDVKPSNVLVDDAGHVALIDYGVARPMEAPALTPQGLTVGTPRYMAPEQALGRQIDGRADVYSTGALLFELVTGAPLFDATDDAAWLAAHVSQPPPDAAASNPSVPAALAAVISRALAKEPDQRFRGAEAFKLALADSLAPEAKTATARPARSWEAVTTPAVEPLKADAPKPYTQQVEADAPSRRRALAVLALGSVVAAAGFWYVRTRRPRSVPPSPGGEAQPLRVTETPVDAGARRASNAETADAATALTTGTVDVQVTEGTAWVEVDGKQRGPTPQELVLDAGVHTVKLQREGTKPVTRVLHVTAGGFQTLFIEMEHR